MRENWPHADSRSCGMGGPIHLLARWHKRRSEPDFSFILVLRMFVVFINRCLGFCVVVTFVLLVPANRLVRKTVFFCTSQVIGQEDCLQDDLLCVEWNFKHYCTIPYQRKLLFWKKLYTNTITAGALSFHAVECK